MTTKHYTLEQDFLVESDQPNVERLMEHSCASISGSYESKQKILSCR